VVRNRKSKASWFRTNWVDIRFLLVFAACMGLYYVLTLTPPIRQGFFPAYLKLNASVCGTILHLMGEDVSVQDKAIVSASGPSIQLERGCDAVEPSALFVSAVLASPVALLPRLAAAAGGVLVLGLLNLVRVVSLFLVRLHFPAAFDAVHLDVWQALFIFLAIALWALWASRVAHRRVVQSHVST